MILLLLAAIFLLVFLFSYNGLNQHRQDIRIAWSQMDQQLKNRYLLLPELIAASQSGGGSLIAALPQVSAAKNFAAVAVSPAQLASAETALSAAIHQVILVGGQDTCVNDSKQFAQICRQLIESEQRIRISKYRYNEQVHLLNAALSNFPGVFVAKMVGIYAQPFFEPYDQVEPH